MFCKHLWGPYHPTDGQYQICDKCHKVRPVACAHKFKVYKEFKLYNWNEELCQYKIILMCENCGIIKCTKIRV